MFQAILNSKVRDQFENIKKGESWRKIYRETEDFFTAAIFGRLVYLKPEIFWHIIKTAVVSKSDLPDGIGALKMVEFWPRWEFSETCYEDLGFYKEPDVFLRFEKYDLIIEAKLRDKQTAGQWAFEHLSYLEQIDLEPRDESFLFAIGGMADCNTNLVHSMEDEANEIIFNKNTDTKINVIACSWQMLMNSLKTREKEAVNMHNEINQYLIKDIIDILSFHGFRNWEWLKDLPKFSKLRSIKQGADKVISNWCNFKSELTESAPEHWWQIAEEFRPIESESINILRRSL